MKAKLQHKETLKLEILDVIGDSTTNGEFHVTEDEFEKRLQGILNKYTEGKCPMCGLSPRSVRGYIQEAVKGNGK